MDSATGQTSQQVRDAGNVSPGSVNAYRRLHPGPGRSREEVAANQRARIHRATVEIVAEHGYGALKIGELVRLAGISKRTFYELFDDKDECFLGTYELIVRRIRQRAIAAQGPHMHWRRRLELGLLAFGRGVADERKAARFALVEAFAGGPAALRRMRATGETFEALLAEIFADPLGGAKVPSLVLKGIVAGVECVARARLLEGRARELPDLAVPLAEWALCLACPEAAALERLRGAGLPLLPAASLPSDLLSAEHLDQRTRILAVTLSLAAERGYQEMTVPRLRAAARVSRKTFDRHFEGVSDCFAAALALLTKRALKRTSQAALTTPDWPLGVYRALLELCHLIARDPVFAKLAFVEVFASGAGGLSSREEIMGGVTKRFRKSAPIALRPSELAAEASVGAVWGVVHQHIATGQAQQLPEIATTLGYLALAPSVGARRAIATMMPTA